MVPPDSDTYEGLVLRGERALLARPRRMLLLSRLPRRPHPGSPWVRAVVQTVNALLERGEVLVTGLGRPAYDVALAACKARGGAAIVVRQHPFGQGDEDLYAKGLLPRKRLLVAPAQAGESKDPRPERDTAIGRMATCATALHVRDGGLMARVGEALRARGCPVEAALLAPDAVQARKQAPSPPVSEEPLDGSRHWPYLVHLTREPDGPWPDESPAAYAAWLSGHAGDHAHAPREALDTLQRIVETNRLRASTQLMPFAEPMICWTRRPPWQWNELIRYRPALRRWTFRPYGVAIEREILETYGTRPVLYGSEEMIATLSRDDRLYAQKHAPDTADWYGEDEWRVRGDLDLAAIPDDAKLLLVPTRAEARALHERFGLLAKAICE